MTDGPGEQAQPDEGSDDTVRRLLTAAALPQPRTPDEVTDRLDLVLAGLVAERAAAESPSSAVASLDRRRRRWPQVLAAAAAVSVVGLGLGQVVGHDAEMAADSASAGSGVEYSPDVADDGAEDSGPARRDARVESDLDAPAPLAERDEYAAEPTLRLRTSSLTLDLQRIEDFALAVPAGRRWSTACVQPDTGRGDEWLPVHVDGSPGILVLRAPTGERRRAEVYTCEDGDQAVASTTVDAR